MLAHAAVWRGRAGDEFQLAEFAAEQIIHALGEGIGVGHELPSGEFRINAERLRDGGRIEIHRHALVGRKAGAEGDRRTLLTFHSRGSARDRGTNNTAVRKSHSPRREASRAAHAFDGGGHLRIDERVIVRCGEVDFTFRFRNQDE